MQVQNTLPEVLALESMPVGDGRLPTSDIWKIRVVKSYPEAHTHLLVGRVLRLTMVCIEIDCQALSFGRSVNKLTDVRMGARGVRIIPWSRVEIADVLEPNFDFERSELMLGPAGHIELTDGEHCCDVIDAHGMLRY